MGKWGRYVLLVIKQSGNILTLIKREKNVTSGTSKSKRS